MPLAPLTKVTKAGLPHLVGRMAERINPEPKPRKDKLWSAALLLMGWRYDAKTATHLIEKVWKDMRDSTTYQAILREGEQKGRKEGRIVGERQLVLRLGTKKFGKPRAATVAALKAIDDADRLEALGLRIIDADVRNWDDLLRGE